MEDPFEQEFLQNHALFSRLPRIHVITTRKLEHNNNNPLLQRLSPEADQQRELPSPPFSPFIFPPMFNFRMIVVAKTFNQGLPYLRQQLIKYIGGFLEGDALAAEFLFLSLFSSVYLRRDELCMGKFSINISNCPTPTPTAASGPSARPPTPPSILGHRDAAAAAAAAAAEAQGQQQTNDQWIERVTEMIASLVPKSHKIPLSLEVLNRDRFLPSKDYKTLQLKSSELQLTSGTVLVLDETAMKAGKLIDQGLRNLHALQRLIKAQSMQYDFQFYSLQFHTNIPVVIFSEGKSMLENDSWVPLEPLNLPVPQTAAGAAPGEEILNQFRTFISLLRLREYEIAPEVATQVEQEFAQQRQQAHLTGAPKVSQEDLFSRLALARLLAISFGEGTLTSERWQYARELEAQRLARVQAHQRRQQQQPRSATPLTAMSS